MTDPCAPDPAHSPPVVGRSAPAGTEHLAELIRQTIDPLQLMQRVADQLVAMIDAADGVLVGLQIDPDAVRFVCGAGRQRKFVGESMALRDSLSGQAMRDSVTLIADDTETDTRVNRTATRTFGVRSSVHIPLGRGNGSVGVLNVCSSSPCAFDAHDVALLGGLAEFISTAIGAASDLMMITDRLCGLRRPEAGTLSDLAAPARDGQDAERTGQFVAHVLDPAGAERVERHERIERRLLERDYEIVFQPIFDLRDGEVFALEALARFDCDPYRPPDVWLAEAHRVGLGVELEVALLRSAVEQLERLPAGAVLTLNAGPEALCSPTLLAALAAADPGRLVIELTEHVAVEDYPALNEALSELRASGVRLAIDDAGSGFASLMHILRLAPEFIKLDRQLISSIDVDPVRRSLASSLMRFAEETGATMIAEGVETASELDVLEGLGIRHAQGYYLGRPAPIGQIDLSVRGGRAAARRARPTSSSGSERSPRPASLGV
jgi:EAL domain-containing protein (putative c-di-GMP-specific phosphodiesterase class I)